MCLDLSALFETRLAAAKDGYPARGETKQMFASWLRPRAPVGPTYICTKVLGAYINAGDILGHGPMGIVEAVGPEVTTSRRGRPPRSGLGEINLEDHDDLAGFVRDQTDRRGGGPGCGRNLWSLDVDAGTVASCAG